MPVRVVGFPKTQARQLRSKQAAALVNDARMKLEAGMAVRDEVRESLWKRSERQYSGDHWSVSIYDTDPNLRTISVNMSFSTANTIVPYVTGNEPTFLVTPSSRNATILSARTLQALLNSVWRDNSGQAQEETETATFDAILYGDGYLQVGYDIEERRVDVADYVELARLWVKRVNPWDVWIDPAADGLHNARWVARRIWVTKTELENDDRYFNVSEDQVNYGNLVPDGDGGHNLEFVDPSDDGAQYAQLYEFYDLVHNHMLVFGDGEFPHRWIEDIGELPIVQMGNYRIPRSPYHMGEMEQLWDLQQELNRTRTEMLTHRARNTQKYLAKKGVLDEKARAALQSPVVGEVALVDSDQPLDSVVVPVALANLSGDVYAQSDIIIRDIYEISGVNEYLRGATPAIRRTATEATIIEGASNVKSQHKLRMVERALRKVGRLMLLTAGDVFPTTDYDETVFYVSGRDAESVNRAAAAEEVNQLAQQGIAAPPELTDPAMMQSDVLVSPTPEHFEGEYVVEVEQASTELRNPVLREQKYREIAIEMLGQSPILEQMGITINYRRLLELWFEAAGIDDVDALFEGGGAGAMAQIQQMMGALGGLQGPGGGAPPLPGAPNLTSAQPPTDILDATNTGQFGPRDQ